MEKVKNLEFFLPKKTPKNKNHKQEKKNQNKKANKTNSFISINQGTGLLLYTRECAILKREVILNLIYVF